MGDNIKSVLKTQDVGVCTIIMWLGRREEVISGVLS